MWGGCGGAGDDFFDRGRDLVAAGCCYADVYAEFCGADGEVEEDVVGVTDPGDFLAFEAKAPGGGSARGGGKGFVDGEEIGDGLEWVVEVGEGVDDGDGGVFGKVRDVGVAVDARDHSGDHGGYDDGCVVEGLVDLNGVLAGLRFEHGARLSDHVGRGQ